MKSLGQVTDYKDQYDPSLLERIDRQERRDGYVKMYGCDIWTAFEFSFLQPSGLPFFGVLRVGVGCNSKYIFESKSFKLYLNSFNNTVMTLPAALEGLVSDLEELTQGKVVVKVMNESDFDSIDDRYHSYKKLEDTVDVHGIDFQYEYDKSLLSYENHPDSAGRIRVYSDLLRSNCEITNQPDWGRVKISSSYIGSLSMSSLLQYIVSYRKHQEFHEPTCERIFQDILSTVNPLSLTVMCQYTRRGGIDINPIRTTDESMGSWWEHYLNLPKLIQQ